MDPVYFLRLLCRNWMFILISLVIGVTSAVLVAVNTPPKYSAMITMMPKGAKANSPGLYQPISLQQVKSYANLLSSRRLIEQIVDTEAEIGALQQNITAQVLPDSLLVQATVTDGDAARAKHLADVLGLRFTEMVEEMERQTPSSPSGVTVLVVDRPGMPTQPISPRPPVNVAFGALIALFVSIGSVFLRDRLDTTIKSSDLLQQLSQRYTLGIIPYEKDARRRPLIARDMGSSLRSEAYHSLRANLQFIDIDRPPKALVVTSCLSSEGRSSTASNLAIALAQDGRRVILIDGDLRHTRVPDFFGIEGAVGLTDVLIGKAQLGDAIQRWGELDLHILPSGQIPPNPSELLGSHSMGRVLKELMKSYDMVIIDAPPLLNDTGAATLSAACDGAILVVRYGKTRQEHVTRAKELLSSVEARVVGTVLNAVPARACRHDYGYSDVAEPKTEVRVPVSG
ncbi:polysaccharide biosynthesis tyrosine autokinase [Nonomuraea turcica]|uniref:polysaccharide biosynthesis tyrosine autokinase n=1 Tax=Nonomuraea sp. G32 TaxID=3067274 RepID=UPI00273CC4B6|nr:polysaccharide biosynthesis tyrosine autokinase [Nonomuraea sp. G32]MDP4510634.1 polysaccharide biosynthesis tyrosine autokinase [Nonomuraea sp. G32]